MRTSCFHFHPSAEVGLCRNVVSMTIVSCGETHQGSQNLSAPKSRDSLRLRRRFSPLPQKSLRFLEAPRCAISSAKKIASEPRFLLRRKWVKMVLVAEFPAMLSSASKIASERRCAILVHSAHSIQGPLNGGVSNGGVSRSGLVLPFLSFFVLFGTFPIFPGFSRFARGWSGYFPDLSFSSFSAY